MRRAGFSHEYTSPNQRLIFIDFHPRGRVWGRKEEATNEGGGEDGNFNSIPLVAGWMEGAVDRDCGS